MKNRIRRNRILNTRPLKPKSMLPMQNLTIQSLSFNQDTNGITFVIINPDHITLNSRELISMIEEKRDRIDAGSNGYILGKDILTAIHNHSTKSDKTKASRNDSHNDYHTLKIEEPKRPSNAFILYNNALRKKVKSLFPCYSNSDVSKIVGGMWKSVGNSEKNKYIKQAIECRKLHKERYPNFEYNIKREAEIDCTRFPALQMANNWENYFDWCFQNSMTESSAGVLQYNNDPLIHQSSSFWPNSVIQSDSNCAESNVILSEDFQMSGEWNEICQMVSRFFPGESDQNTLMDEQFWNSLDNFNFFDNLAASSSPGFGESSGTN